MTKSTQLFIQVASIIVQNSPPLALIANLLRQKRAKHEGPANDEQAKPMCTIGSSRNAILTLQVKKGVPIFPVHRSTFS